MLFWYSCVSVFFVIFATNSVYFEVQGAISFLSKRHDMQGRGKWARVKECILLKQRATYSGYRTRKYLARSAAFAAHDDQPMDILDWSREERTGLWSKLTQWTFISTTVSSMSTIPFFHSVVPPQQLYTIDDVQDNRPYVTKHTWSLERLFCRPRNLRYVVIVGGPGALTKGQMRSSLVCSVLGMIAFFLLILSFLVWMRLSAARVVVVMILCLVLSIPLWKDLRRLVKVTRRVFVARDKEKKQERQSRLPQTITREEHLIPDARRLQSRRESESRGETNEGMFLVSQEERITKASDLLCWLALGFEILFFFVYPAIVLLMVQNFQMACLFAVVAGVSGTRYYINLLTIVEETGQMSLVGGGDNARIRWSKQSRLNDLIVAISYNKTRQIWQVILAGCGLLWLVLFLGASQESFESTFEGSLTFVDGFSWTPPPEDVRYPTCDLSKSTAFGANATLADYAFLTTLPYKTDELAETQLAGWFEGVNVVEDRETLREFRIRNKFQNLPVFFRLYRFRLENGLDRGVVSIRGTQNNWDIVSCVLEWTCS